MSERLIPRMDWSKPYVLRIDRNAKTPVVEELFEQPQGNIAVAVNKRRVQADFRMACMAGEDHPLCIERHQYILTTVATRSIDASIVQLAKDTSGYNYSNRFSEVEMNFIASVQRQPEVEWAVDNSFDGIYVQKYEDHGRLATSFQFAVYMKEEQATFWRLKYSGR